jgi:uncharacterized membrane protein YphA (DoxX/SURF4 family)
MYLKTVHKNSLLSNLQQWAIIVLRIIVGWHLLHEGLVKLTGEWSAESFLLGSQGFLSGVFRWMASQPAVLDIVDFLNVWGLILIGLGLFLGIFARIAVYAGIILLFLYYLAYPPLHGSNDMLVNKDLIELVSLVILAIFPSTLNIGLWTLLKKMRSQMPLKFSRTGKNRDLTGSSTGLSTSRRSLLKDLAFIPFMGGFTWAFTSKTGETDAFTGGTITLNQKSLNELEGKIPQGNLGGEKLVSRLIMGGNLISGWSHARDLIYVSSLFKAYNTREKIFETLVLAEKAGINTITIYVTQFPVINAYKKRFGSYLQTMSEIVPTKEDIYGQVNQVIDYGVDYILIQGAACDHRVRDGEIDVVMKCADYIKRQGYPVGLGAHSIQALIACEEAGIVPDYYFKTMHHDHYWSAHPKENRQPFTWGHGSDIDHNRFHDNMWCLFPEETIAFVQKAQKPVVGFKVLAGGAIHPEDGFQYAFDNGADFICVGMFDFQIVEDANITIRSIEKAKNRNRPWFG